MKFFDFTFDSAAENLAADEALLDWREEDGGEDILRFWESPDYFVVAGYANKIETEVNVAACAAKNIPILRRCSGGGTVVQGRGCLNYALVLRIEENPPLANISEANRFIMQRNCEAIQSATGNRNLAISICGHTDLAISGKKFSGNSQRRHKNFLLFHGTFLLKFELKLVNEILQMPSKQPDYRENRGHGDFLINLNLPPEQVKAAMKQTWKAGLALENPPLEKISKLDREKYSSRDWNWKF